MADPRSMLQSERSNRKIKHPHAAYTSTKQLICSACRCPIKSAALWENHLRSEGHLTVVKKARVSRAAHGGQDSPVPSKKRKADTDDEQDNKRIRSGAVHDDEAVVEPITSQSEDARSPEPLAEVRATVRDHAAHPPTERPTGEGADSSARTLDESEWSAFERDMAAMEQSEAQDRGASAVIQGAPIISAAPMTAEQLAAQAREEQSTQKGARETELEEEREDASRQMEEEMGRMEQLDEKMRAWRERKAALRERDHERSVAEANQTHEVDPAALSEESNDYDDKEDDDDDEEGENDDPAWRGLGGV